MIHEKFNVRVAVTTLFDFYKKFGIKFRSCHYQYAGEDVPHEKKYVFARLLSKVIMNGYPLIYADEAAVNMWTHSRKTWSKRDEPINPSLNADRGRNVSMFGAIGNCLRRPFFRLEEKTTQESFIRFLKTLREKVKVEPGQPVYLVMDNAAAHTANLSSEELIDLKFEPVLIPARTPEFNSIVSRSHL